MKRERERKSTKYFHYTNNVSKKSIELNVFFIIFLISFRLENQKKIDKIVYFLCNLKWLKVDFTLARIIIS